MAKKPDPLMPYKQLGVVFTGQSGKDDTADCPFCWKAKALHVNASRGVWVCSSSPDKCGRRGNTLTFLEQWHEFCLDEHTGPAEWEELSEQRGGIPPEAFRWAGVAWNPITLEWMIPSRNAEGAIRDIRHKRPQGRGLSGISGCKANLWGSERLGDPDKAGWPVDLCEGEWDGIALAWLNRRAGVKALVLATPGARGFPESWWAAFKGREVRWHYDKDADGEKYSALGAKKIKALVRSQSFTRWPDRLPEKFDVSDFIKKHALDGDYRKALKKLWSYRTEKHWWVDPKQVESGTEAEVTESGAKRIVREPPVRSEKLIDLETCMRRYRRLLVMNADMEEVFRAMAAVVLSLQLPEDPLWMYVVGPPSGGKTELLMSLSKIPDVSYHSSVTAKSMLSGFKTKEDEDPSLIPKLLGLCAVFKDWTEVLASNEFEINSLSGLLRGAYDGHIHRFFGNGKECNYEGTFNILAGVTHQIHARNDTMMGERFLKIQMKPMSQFQQKRLIAAVLESAKNPKRNEQLQKAAAMFLNRDIKPPFPKLEKWMAKKINSLARFVSQVRTAVPWQREGGDKFLAYEPSAEVGLRLAKQFEKFGTALAIVDGSDSVGEKQYPLIHRVAMDTAYGWPLQALHSMLSLGPCDIKSLAAEMRQEYGSVRRIIRDMQAIGMVVKRDSKVERTSAGRPAEEWHVSKATQQLCMEVELDVQGRSEKTAIALAGS